MIPWLLLLVSVAWTLPTDLRDCSYCKKNAGRCEKGQVVMNERVHCTCSYENLYQCRAVASDEKQENVILDKPTKAMCEPRMVFVLKSLTCICSKAGYWPHDKCEINFGSLHNSSSPEDMKTQSKSMQLTQKKTQSAGSSSSKTKRLVTSQHCEPNSYVIQDCNVCRCNGRGVVDRCTKNDCSREKVKTSLIRRTFNNPQDKCVPDDWYLMSPCQFCLCQRPNRLVCSTRYRNLNSTYRLAAYNLTDCGPDLVQELSELVADAPTTRMRKTPTTTPTMSNGYTDATRTNTNVSSNAQFKIPTRLEVNDPNPEYDWEKEKEEDNDEYEKEDEEEDSVKESPRQIPLSTASVPIESNENSNEISQSYNNVFLRLPEESSKPYQESTTTSSLPQMSLKNMMTGSGLPDEFIQALATMPEASNLNLALTPKKSQYDLSIQPAAGQEGPLHTVRVQLPPVLDNIIRLALRKSMVRIDTSRACQPGVTTQIDCNYCYCLTNGKQLCTDKKTC